MGVKLVSASGGSVEINPPATASNFVATMPAGTGNVVVNGVNGSLVLGTAQASTSGTSIDFTGIPSWVRRITVMFSGVSTNGSSVVQVQLGAGSVLTTGYSNAATNLSTVASSSNSTTGFQVGAFNSAANIRHGSLVLNNISGNNWGCFGVIALSEAAATATTAGSVSLSGALDRVRITTVNGTDTFDAGTINIMYE